MADPEHLKRLRQDDLHLISVKARKYSDMVEAAERRGHFVDKELNEMRKAIDSDLPYLYAHYKIVSKESGINPPERDYLLRRSISNGVRCVVTRDKDVPQVFLYGELGRGFDKISGPQFVELLQSEIPSDQDIDVRIHSVGGDLVDSTIIAEAISARRGQTRGLVDGIAASGASIALMRCNPIGIAHGGRIMIHFSRVSNFTGPQSAVDLAKALDRVRNADRELAGEYVDRWKGTGAELVQAMSDEKDFIGQDAVEWGLADYVTATTSIATTAEIEAAWKQQNMNPGNSLDRRNFVKYRTEFQRWSLAAKYMESDADTLMESIRRSQRERK